jgi:hypothetical protein
MTLRSVFTVAAIAVLVVALLPGSAISQQKPRKPSRAVEGTLTGCVIGNAFYSVYQGVRAHRTSLPASIDLLPLEGRTVRMTGLILPGNNFKPTAAPEVLQATCAAHLVPAIRLDLVVDHRTKGQQAAKKGDYKGAYRLLGLAVILDPANCDTYVDRAYIHALRGDEPAAVGDLGVLEKGDCANPDKANHLLLQDVAGVFERQGRRDRALATYRMALAACEKGDHPDLCRDGILENIRRVSGPKQGGTQ